MHQRREYAHGQNAYELAHRKIENYQYRMALAGNDSLQEKIDKERETIRLIVKGKT